MVNPIQDEELLQLLAGRSTALVRDPQTAQTYLVMEEQIWKEGLLLR